MKGRDKQAYLEEYELLKKKGKPFFPYAVMKDSTMALIVVAVIIAMSIILGAEQGPKVNPTTTTYVPRPDWYFYLPLRGAARPQRAGTGADRDDRHSHGLHGPPHLPALL